MLGSREGLEDRFRDCLDVRFDKWSVDVEKGLEFVKVDFVRSLSAEECIYGCLAVGSGCEKGRWRAGGDVGNIVVAQSGEGLEVGREDDLADLDVECGCEGVDVVHGQMCRCEMFKHVQENGETRVGVLGKVVRDVSEERGGELYGRLLQIFEFCRRIDSIYKGLLVRKFVAEDLCTDPFVVACTDWNGNLKRTRV